MPSKSQLSRPATKHQLIHALARGDQTQTELAKQHNVHHSAITRFITRHHHEIEAARQDLTNELAGIWIANKRVRLRELQDDIQHVNELLGPDLAELLDDYADNPDERTQIAESLIQTAANPNTAALLNAKRAALKQAAEELGDLTQHVAHEIVTYQIAGIETQELT